MRLSNVIHLYRVRLRSRVVQELLALAGISVGVALVFAALIANTSLSGSMRQMTEGIIGDATLEVAARGPDGFGKGVVEAVRAADGVAAAAPILTARVNLAGPSGRRSLLLIGGDASFSRLGGVLLPEFRHPGVAAQRALALPDAVAEDIGVSLGQRMRVEVDARATRVPLATKLGRDEIGALAESPVALAPLPVAQDVTGRDGRASRVFVRTEPGREQDVRRALERIAAGRLDVRAASAEVSVFRQAVYPTNQSTALFSVLSALVGFLFALSAMLLTVAQRRRLVADLRMAGYEPWVVVQLLLFDALVLGSAGSLVGLGVGDQLSRHLFDDTPGYLSTAFPVGSQRIVTWEAVAIATAAGLLAASIAVLVPLRDVLRRGAAGDGGEREARRAEGRGAVAGGAACLAGTTAVVAVAPEAAVAGLVALTASLLLLLPTLLRLSTAAFQVLGRRFQSPVPVLAALELGSRDARTRTLALAATGAVAVFATVAIGGANADLKRGLDASAADIDSNADIWVTFAGSANTLATTPFSPRDGLTARVAALDGVTGVHPYRGGFLDVGDHRAWVLAPPRSAVAPVPPSQVTAGDPAVARERLRAGGWLALSAAIADEEGVGVGDRYRLDAPVPSTFRVAALLTNLGWPPGAIVMNAADYARAWGSREVSALHVGTHGSPPEVARRIEARLGDGVPLRVETRQERIDRHYGTARDGLARLTQISVLVLISAILAMAVAMGGMIWQRRPTIAALKVHGYPESELWKALLLESGLLLGTGCLAGAVFGLYGQVLMSRALEAITGFPVFYSTALVGAVAILGVVTAVAVAMLALPGWLAVRVRPAPGVPT